MTYLTCVVLGLWCNVTGAYTVISNEKTNPMEIISICESPKEIWIEKGEHCHIKKSDRIIVEYEYGPHVLIRYPNSF